jgi:hypothetical protein
VKATIGQTIAAKARGGEAIADLIDAAIADAFKSGFEHAVAGGKEAARKCPQLGNAMPLVLYFVNAKDRQEFADMIHEAKPHMIETKIPE